MNVEVMLRVFFLLGESINEKVKHILVHTYAIQGLFYMQHFGSAAKPESPFHSTMAMVRIDKNRCTLQ